MTAYQFLDLILDDPHKPWDWFAVSSNPNITWDIVCELNNLPWSETGISMNPSIGIEIIKNNPQYDWDFYYVSQNPNITYKDILDIGIYKDWDWESLASNHSINWVKLAKETSIDFSQFIDEDLLIKYQSSSPYVSWKTIVNSLDLPWEWDGISTNPNITWDIVKSNLDKQWSWYHLSAHPNITVDTIIANSYGHPWNWDALSLNKNLTWEHIQNNPEIPWNWNNIYMNPSIHVNNFENLVSFEDASINRISFNPNLTPSVVRDNEIRWNWYGISQNPMDQPFFTSNQYKKNMANNLSKIIYTELLERTCYPTRHPSNYLSISDCVNHPLYDLSQSDLNRL